MRRAKERGTILEEETGHVPGAVIDSQQYFG